MRVWQRPVFIVNGVLGLLVLGGGFWAYQSVASEPAAAATTGQQRLVAVSQGEVSARVGGIVVRAEQGPTGCKVARIGDPRGERQPVPTRPRGHYGRDWPC